MKKILIATGIFAPDIGGPASYAKALGEHLATKTTVTVVTYSSIWNDPNDARLPFRIIRVWRKWPWFFRNAFYGLKVFFQAPHHDTIYSLSIMNGAIVSLISGWFWKKKVLIRVPGDYAWQSAAEKGKTSLLIDDFQKVPKHGWFGFLARLQAEMCRRAQGIIVPSKYLIGIVKGWGVPEERIHLIYNGSDFRPAEITKEDARKQIGVAGNIILSAGRMVPWKGFRMLIKIMPQLLQISQFFRLVIVGDGPDFKPLQAMVKNLNLDRKVHLVGRKSSAELAVYLAAADMFVLNTGYEGFSHQILEAMAAGVPVITTAVGGNPEIVEQGENGLLVKYNDEFNLIEAIKSIHDLPDLCDKFIAEGRKTAEKFSIEKMLKETEHILND